MTATYVQPPIIKASEVPDEWGFNILIYGHPGAGKTVLAASAQDSPHGRDVLFLDCEAGTRSISDREDIDVISITAWEQMGQTYDWLVSPDTNHSYKTIVIDTLTALQELKLAEIMAVSKNETPTFDEWNKLNSATNRMFRSFKDLATDKGYNVIFVCWETEEKNEQTGAVLTRPALTPAAARYIMGSVDIIGHLGYNSKEERVLRLQGTASLSAKAREPSSRKVLEPQYINPSMVTILDAQKGA